jgi:signal peptide peptidase SppA
MRFARIISKLYAEPLLLEPAAWRAFDHALRNLINTESPAFAQGYGAAGCSTDGSDPAPKRHERILQFPSLDTAIIYLDGVIDKHVSLMDLVCYGGVDLDDVDAALAQVANDQQIRNVLLVLNSPGGSVIGVPETAAKVRALARMKNVKAFSDSKACSGAIYIGSQASEFFVTESAYTGSIGVILPPIIDISKALAAQGIETTTIKSGKYKDMGSMLRPITEEEIALLQERSDKIFEMFTRAVRSGRPRMRADAMEGQTFFGAEAVQVGLADAVVADLSEALAQF